MNVINLVALPPELFEALDDAQLRDEAALWIERIKCGNCMDASISATICELHSALGVSNLIKLLYIAYRVGNGALPECVHHAIFKPSESDVRVQQIDPTVSKRLNDQLSLYPEIDHISNPVYDSGSFSSALMVKQICHALRSGKAHGKFIVVPALAVLAAFAAPWIKIPGFDVAQTLSSIAVLSTIFVVIYVYFDYKKLFGRFKGDAGNLLQNFVLLSLAFLGCSVGSFYFIFQTKNSDISRFFHLLLASLSLVCLAIFDHVAAKQDPSATSTDIFSRLLWYVDLPSAIGLFLMSVFSLTAIYLFPHEKGLIGENAHWFQAGGLTLVLFTSNFAFAWVASRSGTVYYDFHSSEVNRP